LYCLPCCPAVAVYCIAVSCCCGVLLLCPLLHGFIFCALLSVCPACCVLVLSGCLSFKFGAVLWVVALGIISPLCFCCCGVFCGSSEAQKKPHKLQGFPLGGSC
jgi:hypothetical protein